MDTLIGSDGLENNYLISIFRRRDSKNMQKWFIFLHAGSQRGRDEEE